MKKVTLFVICLTILFVNFSRSASAANRYWVGSLTNTSWSKSTNWATTSGGTGGASVPSTTDTAIFDGLSLFNCTLDVPINVAGLKMQSGLLKTVTQLTNSVTISKKAIFSGGTFAAGTGDIYVGDLTINSVAFASTAGTLYISGNLTINALTFAQVAGTVVFNGSSQQTINVNTLLSVVGFYNLKINNSGSGVALSSDVKVTNILNMTQGNIALNNHTITLGIVSAVGVLSYTSGYMTGLGTFSRFFPITSSLGISIGDMQGLFPMGEGNYSRKVWVAAGTGIITTAGIISVSHKNATGFTNFTTFMDAGASINSRFNTSWTVSESGLGLSLLGGGNFFIRIEGQGLGTLYDYSSLHMTNATSATGTHLAATGSNTTPQVNRQGCELLDKTYYISSDTRANPLPVKLIDFRGKYANGSTQLDWVTASEINNSHFEVQYSNDGINYSTAGIVKGQGTTNAISNYHLTHPYIFDDVIYYRLKQVDYNGKFEYSPVIAIQNLENKTPAAASMSVYPNPASGANIHLELNNVQPGIASLTLVDMQSRTLRVETIFVESKSQTTPYTLPANLKTGMYVIQLINSSQTLSQRIQVQ